MIVFVHLLNDRSGSPRVLCSVISALKASGEPLRLLVGSQGSGCLDEAGIPTTRYWYRHTPYRVVTLFTYLFSQCSLMLRLLRDKSIASDALIYVNTLLPFGAAVFGRLTRRRVVYHLHEVSVSPRPLRWLLTRFAQHTATRLIYVSEYHRHCLPIPGVASRTIYNALAASFAAQGAASTYQPRRNGLFNVLMLASLRDYKGVPEFMALARRFIQRPDIRFHLVLNDEEAAVRRYFSASPAGTNVDVHPRCDRPAVHYARASLVLNLSRPDQWIETFGLTLLEAMAFGVPVIAPPIGGPLELVSDGNEGFLVDCRDTEQLADRVGLLADDAALCLRLSQAARRRAGNFSEQAFATALRDTLGSQVSEEADK